MPATAVIHGPGTGPGRINFCYLTIDYYSAALMKPPAELTDLFRARGLKVTPQRQCIFRILHGSEGHPTAEAVYAEAAGEMPTLSLRTVYQTLHDLANMGEICELDLGTGSARFDPNPDTHHHLVCTSCGKVSDLFTDFDVRLPSTYEQTFRVSNTQIVFRGTCQACHRDQGGEGQQWPS